MIAKITPLLSLPSTVDVFDYFVPEELRSQIKAGQLVSIPWRSSQVKGVVLNIKKEVPPSTFRARPIRKILNPDLVLTPAQFQLINKFGQYYFCPSGAVARLIIPDMPERTGRESKKTNEPIKITIGKKQLSLLTQAVARINNQTRHLTTQDFSSFIWLIFYLIKKSKFSNLLLLFPTLDILERVHGILIQQYDNITIIHSHLSKGAYWRAYQKILKGQAKIVLSTRQGVFLPIPKGSQIVFWNATSQDFKQYDQHPRYDARTVANWVAQTTNSQLLFASASPPFQEPVPSIPRAGVGVVLPPASSRQTTMTFVDMKSQPSFSPISEQAFDAITESLNSKNKAVVIGLKNEDKIKAALTKELKNVKDIIVTTPAWLQSHEAHNWRKQIGCLLIYSIEPLLALPDYRSSERVYHRLQEWKLWAQELLIPKIILQSYSPDNLAVRAFVFGEYDQFIQSELKCRRDLLYPPFVGLVKVAYKGQDQTEIESLLGQLKSSGVKVLGPYQEYKTKRQSFLLKIKNNVDIPLLRTLPSSRWVVDRDPEMVL